MTDPYATTHEDWDAPADDEAEPTPAELEAPRRKLVDPRTLPVRFHHMRAAGLSGAHAMLAFQGDSPDSLASRLGSGVHAFLFGKPFAVWRKPAKKNPSKIAPRSGDAWKEFQLEHAGKVILSIAEQAQANRICDAIHAHAHAERLLFSPDVIHERSIIWAQNGRARQSTPDARGDDKLIELKTTRCAAPFRFLRDAEKMGYHAQLADQRAAIAHERGRAPRSVYIVAVENVPPYIVQVYEVLPSALEQGERLCEIWLDKLQVYEATDLWGGYSQRIEPWELLDSEPVTPDPDWMTGAPTVTTEGTP
jgi:hypothetical protein